MIVAFIAAMALVFGVLLGSGASRPHGRAEPVAAGAPQNRASLGRSHRQHAVLTRHGESAAIASTLRHTSYIRSGRARRRELALTFDDGPSAFTSQILRVLLDTRTPATFFVIGRPARLYPRLVADEARDRFVVGDHTETHAFLSLLSTGAQEQQIGDGASAIRAAGAPSPVLFRPPYGSFDAGTLGILHAARMLMVLWSVDTSDYARPGTDRIVYTAISGAQPGAIILMHDGGGDRSETVAALPRIIKRLRQRHFRLVTVPQLVKDDPPPFNQPPPQPLSGRS